MRLGVREGREFGAETISGLVRWGGLEGGQEVAARLLRPSWPRLLGTPHPWPGTFDEDD